MANSALRCGRCLWARRRTAWGTPITLGHVRCAHPIMKASCAVLEGDRESAAGHLKIRGPLAKDDPRRESFRWPWDFNPSLLWHCSGLEENRRAEMEHGPETPTAATPQKEHADQPSAMEVPAKEVKGTGPVAWPGP